MSAARRRLRPEDLSDGLSFATLEHVVISVEFSDFAGKPSEEGLFLDAAVGPDRARVTYRVLSSQDRAPVLSPFLPLTSFATRSLDAARTWCYREWRG